MLALIAVPSASLTTVIILVLLSVIVALVAWGLQLMQAANDRSEFSLMLAGCMVCSAAAALATVMVFTITSPEHLMISYFFSPSKPEDKSDLFVVPWDDSNSIYGSVSSAIS